jgi:thioredoxin reductase (NADPH)
MDRLQNVIIIGSGCAGWTAAIYAARANLKPLVITGPMPGGLLTTTSLVENYPGFTQGIDGNDLMAALQQQAERFGAQVYAGRTVEKVDFRRKPFEIFTDGETIQSRAVVIATGAGHRHLGMESESRLEGKGVTYCATCDGPLPVYRNKPLVVVGGGDSACEEALYLTRFASEVFLVHRRDQLRASKIMSDRLLAHPKIRPIWDSVVEEVLDVSKDMVTGVKLKNVKSQESRVVACAGVFVAIGHVPNSRLFQGQIDLREDGYVVVQHPTTRTSVDGVFACGDCVDHIYRQAITAAGTGCSAAIDVERYLASQQ